MNTFCRDQRSVVDVKVAQEPHYETHFNAVPFIAKEEQRKCAKQTVLIPATATSIKFFASSGGSLSTTESTQREDMSSGYGLA